LPFESFAIERLEHCSLNWKEQVTTTLKMSFGVQLLERAKIDEQII